MPVVETISVAAFKPITDIVAGALLTTFLKRRPENQVKTGDAYLERALCTMEKYRDILDDNDRREVEMLYDNAIVSKASIVFGQGRMTAEKSRQYKRDSRAVNSLADHRSRLKRQALAFAVKVADTAVEVTDQHSVRNSLDEDLRNELHSNIVDAVEASSDVPEDSSTEDMIAAAEHAWALPQFAGLLHWLRGD